MCSIVVLRLIKRNRLSRSGSTWSIGYSVRCPMPAWCRRLLS